MTKSTLDIEKTFFIADLHFGHKNALKFPNENRNFRSVEEMNERMIASINSTIQDDSDLIILGDFCMDTRLYKVFAPQIKGKKHLILGNHDNYDMANSCGCFCEIESYKEFNLIGKKENFYCCAFHYPMLSWNKKHFGSIQVYGHIHGKEPEIKLENAYNVFCGNLNFVPQTALQLMNTYGYTDIQQFK